MEALKVALPKLRQDKVLSAFDCVPVGVPIGIYAISEQEKCHIESLSTLTTTDYGALYTMNGQNLLAHVYFDAQNTGMYQVANIWKGDTVDTIFQCLSIGVEKDKYEIRILNIRHQKAIWFKNLTEPNADLFSALDPGLKCGMNLLVTATEFIEAAREIFVNRSTLQIAIVRIRLHNNPNGYVTFILGTNCFRPTGAVAQSQQFAKYDNVGGNRFYLSIQIGTVEYWLGDNIGILGTTPTQTNRTSFTYANNRIASFMSQNTDQWYYSANFNLIMFALAATANDWDIL